MAQGRRNRAVSFSPARGRLEETQRTDRAGKDVVEMAHYAGGSGVGDFGPGVLEGAGVSDARLLRAAPLRALPLQDQLRGLYLSNPVKRVNYMEAPMKERVEQVIGKLRPMLQRDGGDIELVDVTDGVVKVRLTGACGSCPMSMMTLKMGVENALKKEIPEVKQVVAA